MLSDTSSYRSVDLCRYRTVFLEPENSHIMANVLGFNWAQCFDIVDACMSWVRALYLVDSLFKSRVYRNAIIINAELNMIREWPAIPEKFRTEKRRTDLLYLPILQPR